ncbi:unnamed protein product [Brassica napus]|uniref:(rape) hypothetical protein n=1 Tax=Brassica napus TaxID=3708 RepID=A0A816P089_BRANA|nr:unnamed protein product [Brassica napus]
MRVNRIQPLSTGYQTETGCKHSRCITQGKLSLGPSPGNADRAGEGHNPYPRPTNTTPRAQIYNRTTGSEITKSSSTRSATHTVKEQIYSRRRRYPREERGEGRDTFSRTRTGDREKRRRPV